MFTQDPFQYSAASFRLAGMMVETQMRVMFALTDATFGGTNPFLYPPVSKRVAEDAQPSKPASAAIQKKPRAAVVKPTHKTSVRKTSPKSVTCAKPKTTELHAHPAE